MLFLRFVSALILILLSTGYSISFYHVIAQWREISLWFYLGFLSYLIIHLFLYKPIFLHVVGHELTHAFWTFIFGGKTSSIKATAKGGQAVVSKSNFLINLAPYFFPLYTFIVLIVFFIVDKRFLPYVIFAIGFTLAFHVCLTIGSLLRFQSDIQISGFVNSILFIYLVNLIIVGLIIALTSNGNIKVIDFFGNGFYNTIDFCKWVYGLFFDWTTGSK